MIPSVRIEADHLRARCSLAAASRLPPGERRALLADARRHIRRLSGQRASWAKALALPLEAALAFQHNKHEQAVELLREAEVALEHKHMRLFAAAARRRRGELIGGEEGAARRTEADQLLAKQRVKDPSRMLEMLAPGFASPAD
jgi:hypothetical protein